MNCFHFGELTCFSSASDCNDSCLTAAEQERVRRHLLEEEEEEDDDEELNEHAHNKSVYRPLATHFFLYSE